MVFHWNLNDINSPQVSRTLLSILAVLNNAIVWMVSTRPPTSKTSNPFNNPLVTVPNAPFIIGIIVTCIFHIFFNFLARSRYLSFFSHSFSFILRLAGTAKSTILQVLFFFFLLFFFLLIIIRSGLLPETRWALLSLFLLLSIYCLGIFHISFRWWFFTGVWMTSSLLKCPGLFSVCWPFSKML